MHRLRLDNIVLLALIVGIGVVITTTVQAAEPELQWPGVSASNRMDCPGARAGWTLCAGHWDAFARSPALFGDGVDARVLGLATATTAPPGFGLVFTYRRGAQRDTLLQAPSPWLGDAGVAGLDQFDLGQGAGPAGFGMHMQFAIDPGARGIPEPMLYFGVNNRW